MKKAVMFFAGVAFIASLTSCKKDWTCTCSTSGISATVTIANATKSDAEDACTTFEINGTSCELAKK